MNFVKRFLAFWFDFIVGDDWIVAAGVVVLLVCKTVENEQAFRRESYTQNG